MRLHLEAFFCYTHFMREHTFIGDFDFSQKHFSIIDQGIIHQVHSVLRLKAGDLIVLHNGKGEAAHAEIAAVGHKILEVRIFSVASVLTEPSVQGILFCAVAKKDKFEWVVEKATEAGIVAIVPVITERTVKLSLNHERMRKIAKEASEQSGRGVVPYISEPLKLTDAMEQATKDAANIFFEKGAKRGLADLFKFKSEFTEKSPHVGIFIGPEGGWSDKEIKDFVNAKYFGFNMGPRTLRTETAAIIASFLISAEV